MNNIQKKCPRSYFGLGLFVTCVLFCPLGPLAIYYGAFVKKYWEYGDVEKAVKYSKKARMWGLISIPVAVICWMIFVFFTEFIVGVFR